MLSKKSRISKVDFKSLGRGASYHSPFVSLSVYKRQSSGPSQFSFVCSKKVAKSAVKRNLLRRRGYASVEKLLEHIVPGHYYVFNFKKPAESASFADIRDGVCGLLKKAKAF